MRETSVTQVQEQLVADILAQVQQQVGAARFNVWFRNSTQFALAENELRVGVPNLFVCDYLESRFARVLGDIASKKVGQNLAVRFHIDPQLFRERRQAQLAQGSEFIESQTSSPSSQKQPAPVANAKKDEPESGGPLLTLDRFVVGDCNRVAHAAALEVSAKPGRAFNPLFIHGSCGLGKTHLLQGIVQAVRQRDRNTRVLYITAEEFTNRFIMAVKTHSLDAFRHRFRNLDVLVIDDIHFLAHKEATQEEFLHTFNAFDMANRQVVLASDSHPKMIQSLQDSLVNRFVAGLVTQLTPPDRKTRSEILRHKATRDGHSIPEEVLAFVAQHVTGSVRELEGALIRVLAYAALDKARVSLALAREALADHLSTNDKVHNLEAIIDTVARFFGLARSDLVGRTRTRAVSLPRQVAMALARRLTPLSYPDIGRMMGGKNHTTVMAACKRMEAMIAGNEAIAWRDGAAERQIASAELIDTLEDELRR
jgi:chromosomal replication initiator protein